MVLWIVGITALMVAVFILLRSAALARGARRRDERIGMLLKPVTQRLARGEVPTPAELREVAEAPHVRPLLHASLVEHDASECFPREYLEPPEVARALLAHWMMHPNELQEPPLELQPERIVQRHIDGQRADYHLLRYRMRAGHWAGPAWMLGLVGPFIEGDVPFAGRAKACARAGDRAESTEANELVDWFTSVS